MKYNSKIIEVGLQEVLKIAQERTRTLEKLRKAILQNNDGEIKKFAKKLCGLSHEND